MNGIEIPSNLSQDEVSEVCKAMGFERFAFREGKLVVSIANKAKLLSDEAWTGVLIGVSVAKRLTSVK